MPINRPTPLGSGSVECRSQIFLTHSAISGAIGPTRRIGQINVQGQQFIGRCEVSFGRMIHLVPEMNSPGFRLRLNIKRSYRREVVVLVFVL